MIVFEFTKYIEMEFGGKEKVINLIHCNHEKLFYNELNVCHLDADMDRL